MSEQVDAGHGKRLGTLVIGGLLILACLVVGGILGFASGAAIGAAFTDTASDCEFEECVDAGILPGAAIGLIVGALAGGSGWRSCGSAGSGSSRVRMRSTRSPPTSRCANPRASRASPGPTARPRPTARLPRRRIRAPGHHPCAPAGPSRHPAPCRGSSTARPRARPRRDWCTGLPGRWPSPIRPDRRHVHK